MQRMYGSPIVLIDGGKGRVSSVTMSHSAHGKTLGLDVERGQEDPTLTPGPRTFSSPTLSESPEP
jgi:hypothetical protein